MRRAGRQVVVVVGTSIKPRNESLTDLAQLLLVGGPFALLLASLAAYGVAVAALKPVEAMRSRAAEISAAEPDQRLPVPPTDDEVARLGKTLNEMLERLGEALDTSGPSSPTPVTSCAPRWQSCGPSWSWR